MNKRIIATIEARLASSRLPGKVLSSVGNYSVLELMINRLKQSKYLSDVVVATSTNHENLAIYNVCESLGVKCYRGSEDNVLERVVDAASFHSADIVVQLTADCPLIDWEIVDKCISTYLAGDSDYVANDLVRSFPIGMDTAVFGFDLLKSTLFAEDLSDKDKEHVTTYIVDRPSIYRHTNVTADGRICRPDISLTLDTPEDYILIRAIVNSFGSAIISASLLDILEFLDSDLKLAEVNRSVIRKKK